jgi:hypothetical protein
MATVEEQESAARDTRSTTAVIITAVVLAIYHLVRWLLTRGGVRGFLGVALVVAALVVPFVLDNRSWFATPDAAGGSELTTTGTILFFGLLVGGVILWIVGAVRRGRS